jgi:gluconate 2-dehydrogenase gamma chain
MAELSRRALIDITGAIGAAMLPIDPSSELVSAQERPAAPDATMAVQPTMPAAPASDMSRAYLFLNDEELAFIAAAVARLIPEDDKWPGAVQAGVPNYIDKQLGSA